MHPEATQRYNVISDTHTRWGPAAFSVHSPAASTSRGIDTHEGGWADEEGGHVIIYRVSMHAGGRADEEAAGCVLPARHAADK